MTDERPCPLTHRDGAAPELPADRYVCRQCTGTLRGLLTDLPGLMDDLDAALGRRLHFTTRTGSRATTAPLPFQPAASEAGYVARQTILVHLDWVCAVRGHHAPDTWAGVGAYLRDAVDWVARHPDGPQVVDELTAALRQARHAVDRPADRAYVGVCGGTLVDGDDLVQVCAEQLYAHPDRDTVTCPRCGTAWLVAERRARMLDQLRDLVLTATDLARAVDGLGVEVTAQRIRQWKRRGQITPAQDDRGRACADAKGRPLYRVGDVLDAMADQISATIASQEAL